MKNLNSNSMCEDPSAPYSVEPSLHQASTISERAKYEAQIAELQQKLENSCRRQHEIENILEEYEVAKNRQSHQAKELHKKFYELQKKYAVADKERKELTQKVSALEKEKKTATERWVRATSQVKQDDKFKNKMKTIEKEYDSMRVELEEYAKKTCELENEVNVLKSVIETKDELLAKYSQMELQTDSTAIIAALEEEISNLKKENQELSGELIIKREQATCSETLEKKLETLQQDYALLKQENSCLGKPNTISLVGGTIESELTISRTTNDVDSVIMRAHAKIKQMTDCVKKLLEGKSMENRKYSNTLGKYQKISESLFDAERELISIKAFHQPTKELVSQTTIGDKENLPSEINATLDERAVSGIKKVSHQNAFVRRASALMRPASALMNHKVINLPPSEAMEISIPLTAREKQAEKVAEFKKLMRQQNNKSNPKCRSQLSLGDARILRPGMQFSNTPSGSACRLQPRAFGGKVH